MSSENFKDALYVVIKGNMSVLYFTQYRMNVEVGGNIQHCLQEDGFVKISGTTWVNPHFVETVTHKPRHVVLVNNVSLKVSRRCWHRCKNISEKGDATLKMQPNNFNTIKL